MMALAGVELEMLVSEPDSLTNRPPVAKNKTMLRLSFKFQSNDRFCPNVKEVRK